VGFDFPSSSSFYFLFFWRGGFRLWRIGFVQCNLEIVNLACVIAGFCAILKIILFNFWISSFGCPIRGLF